MQLGVNQPANAISRRKPRVAPEQENGVGIIHKYKGGVGGREVEKRMAVAQLQAAMKTGQANTGH